MTRFRTRMEVHKESIGPSKLRTETISRPSIGDLTHLCELYAI